MSEERIEARRRIAAPAGTVWDLVSHPEGHVLIDGSGMIKAARDARRLTEVGQTFDMDMDREPLGDVPLGRYQVRNWVTRIEPGRVIEWSTNLIDSDAPINHVFGWRIDPCRTPNARSPTTTTGPTCPRTGNRVGQSSRFTCSNAPSRTLSVSPLKRNRSSSSPLPS